MTYFLTIRAFLSRVPVWVWIVIGLIALWAWERDRHADQREDETRAEMQAVVDSEKAAHAATKATYRQAQEQAAKMQADYIAAETARQKRITENARKDYQQRLDAIRARADSVRRSQTGTSAGSAPDQVRLPKASEATRRIDGAPNCARLPAPDLETDLACREIATMQAAQLNALITWVQQQSAPPD